MTMKLPNATLRPEEKNPFPKLSDAIKNRYHSLIKARDSKGAKDLVQDTIYLLTEEFKHHLAYSFTRIDQEIGGKSFKIIEIDRISDTLRYQPRQDVNAFEFYSAEAEYGKVVISRIKFPLDIKTLVKGIISELSEYTGVSVDNLKSVLYEDAILEQMNPVLEQVATRYAAKEKLSGNKLRQRAKDFVLNHAIVKQTSSMKDSDMKGQLGLLLVKEERFVKFDVEDCFVVQTVFTFHGKIVWPDA